MDPDELEFDDETESVLFTHSGWVGICPVFLSFTYDDEDLEDDPQEMPVGEPDTWVYRHWCCAALWLINCVVYGFIDAFKRIVLKDVNQTTAFWRIKPLASPFIEEIDINAG